MTNKTQRTCPKCNSKIQPGSEACNNCGNEFKTTNKSSAANVLAINLLIFLAIGLVAFYVMQNPLQIMQYLDNFEINWIYSSASLIIPAIIIIIFVVNIINKAAGNNIRTKKQKIARPGLAEKYICKNCSFEGHYENFKANNNLVIKCPKCNSYSKIWAVMGDGTQQKVAPFTLMAIILIIGIIIILSTYLD